MSDKGLQNKAIPFNDLDDEFEYHGRPFHALFSSFADPVYREKLITTLKNSESGYGWKDRVVGRGQENRHFVAEISIIPLEYENDRPDWYLALITDVTEHQKSIIKANFESILKASLFKDEDTGNHIKRVNACSHGKTHHQIPP